MSTFNLTAARAAVIRSHVAQARNFSRMGHAKVRAHYMTLAREVRAGLADADLCRFAA